MGYGRWVSCRARRRWDTGYRRVAPPIFDLRSSIFRAREDEQSVVVEIGSDFAGKVFDTGGTRILDNVLHAERGVAGRHGYRRWDMGYGGGTLRSPIFDLRYSCRRRFDLISDGGDAKAQPVQLVETGGDDGDGHGGDEWRVTRVEGFLICFGIAQPIDIWQVTGWFNQPQVCFR